MRRVSWRVGALLLCLMLPVSLGAQSAVNRAALSSATCPGSGCVNLSVTGVGGVGVQVTGTFSGTLTFEGSLDGVTYTTLSLTPINSTTSVTTATAAGVWSGGVGGLSVVRVRMSSYTSGTATVTIQNAPTSARGGGGAGGTVSSIATTSPITGGPITTTGTIACATCGVTGSPLSQFAATTSAQLRGVLSDETGSGSAVFATSPTVSDLTVTGSCTGCGGGGIGGSIAAGQVAVGSGVDTITGSAGLTWDGSTFGIAANGALFGAVEAGPTQFTVQASDASTANGIGIGFASGSGGNGPRVMTYLTAGSWASKTAPASGDDLFFFSNNAWNGSAWKEAANLQAKVNGDTNMDGSVPSYWQQSWVNNNNGDGQFFYLSPNADNTASIQLQDGTTGYYAQLKLSGAAEWSLRDGGDTTYANLKAGTITAAYKSSDGTAGTTTTGFKNGLYVSAPGPAFVGILRGVTGNIGGGALTAGSCATGNATVTGATAAMSASASPAADPDPSLSTGVVWDAFVSGADTVTVRVCGLVLVTPNAVAYQVSVIQ